MRWSAGLEAYRVDFALGRRSVARIFCSVDALRREVGQSKEVLTSQSWFIGQSTRSNTLPLVVLISKGNVPFGAVLLHGRKFLGIPTGLFKAGCLCGRGSVVGESSRRH